MSRSEQARQQEQLEEPTTLQAFASERGGRLVSGGSCAHHALLLVEQDYVETLGYLQRLDCVSCDATIKRLVHTPESGFTLF